MPEIDDLLNLSRESGSIRISNEEFYKQFWASLTPAQMEYGEALLEAKMRAFAAKLEQAQRARKPLVDSAAECKRADGASDGKT